MAVAACVRAHLRKYRLLDLNLRAISDRMATASTPAIIAVSPTAKPGAETTEIPRRILLGLFICGLPRLAGLSVRLLCPARPVRQ